MAAPIPINAPRPDPLVELLFAEVMTPPLGYHYHRALDSPQILYPMYGNDQWRLLLCKDGTQEITPVFIEGAFILKLTKALNAMQRELNAAVSDDIGEPVNRATN